MERGGGTVLPNGKQAWEGTLEPGTGGEVKEYKSLASAAHKRWLRKNQVEDVESSLQKDGQGGFTASSAANIVLYVGLGMVAVGLIITFVGLGERGFQTDELKLIGPSLIGSGVLFCLLRIFFCTIGSCSCCRRNDDQRSLITPKPSRVRRSAGPVTRPSAHPNFISDGEEEEEAPGAGSGGGGPSDLDEISNVPVLPPIKGGRGTQHAGEVLLDPKGLDRPPSGGSVMEPLTPARRRDSTSQIENEIDDMIK
ncbi:uncharacterized protein LOC119114351 isoform X2 [Pollicipes pollicipes]|uniref:uncharacterized protein LOC119114351 isoform X2 n=1 Tax=Pollicipes pollicipes TaxID=41117 RepID=UPI0018859DCF|nr:uncharacterized protein LOC119114351 isoform X2 [Pollicipes pollicipes]